MYVQVALSIVLSAVAVSADSNAVDLAMVNARNEERIAKALPVEFAEYRKRLAGDGGLKDANETILLMKKAKAYLLSREPNLPKESERIDTYITAWQLCLRRYEAAADAETRTHVLDAWNQELRADDEAVPFQIYAVNYPWWNRAFVTNDFWMLLTHAKHSKTISAIACVLGCCGDPNDESQLEAKRDEMPSELDVRAVLDVGEAINWMAYRFRPKPVLPLPNSPSSKAKWTSRFPPPVWVPSFLSPSLNTTTIRDSADTPLGPKQVGVLGRPGLAGLIKLMAKGDLRASDEAFRATQKRFEASEAAGDSKGTETYVSQILEWWPRARKETPREFMSLYERWKVLKGTSGSQDPTQGVSRQIRNLGIAALPAIMDKIAHGDSEFIPIVSDLVGFTRIQPQATAAQCLTWWQQHRRQWLIPFPNGRPTAKAGADQVVSGGDIVKLDGSASTDSDGDELSCEWTQLAGPTVTLSDAANAGPTFTAPKVEQQTVLEFRLIVDDAGDLSKVVPTPNSRSEPATVRITANPRK